MLRKSAWDEGLLFLSEFLYLSEISRRFVRSMYRHCHETSGVYKCATSLQSSVYPCGFTSLPLKWSHSRCTSQQADPHVFSSHLRPFTLSRTLFCCVLVCCVFVFLTLSLMACHEAVRVAKPGMVEFFSYFEQNGMHFYTLIS